LTHDGADSEEDIEKAERLNVGIGVVVPVQDILDTVMQGELEEERKRIVKETPTLG
jgi:hypothetical protein